MCKTRELTKYLKIISVLCLLRSVLSIQKYDNIKEALKDYPQQDRKSGRTPKYLYFKLFKDRAREMDYFSRILYQFMSTMGVRPYFVNLKDSILLGVIPIDLQINTKVILETFKDVIESIEVTTKMKD